MTGQLITRTLNTPATFAKRWDTGLQIGSCEVLVEVREAVFHTFKNIPIFRIYDLTDYMPVAVDLGCGTGHIAPHVFADNVGHLIQVEMSEAQLRRAKVGEWF